jgi:hypothetical protein
MLNLKFNLFPLTGLAAENHLFSKIKQIASHHLFTNSAECWSRRHAK